jgi:hypothetical protein
MVNPAMKTTGDLSMPDKARIINHIQDINQTARAEWLDAFEPAALVQYLERLECTREPRGSQSFWVRCAGESPAVTRTPLN